jgi:hypothetical protein
MQHHAVQGSFIITRKRDRDSGNLGKEFVFGCPEFQASTR